jgi:ribosomal protein S18 acetylase RimI-like enzyme
MVTLVPMTEDDFRTYLEYAIPDYAQETVRAGNVHPDVALQAAEKQFQTLLPGGLTTPGQHLCTIWTETGNAMVGYMWFGIREDPGRAFAALYDFVILEPYRRQGHGTQALLALEEQVRGLGLDAIWLHVFGHNHAARALYEKLGYRTKNLTMAKELKS